MGADERSVTTQIYRREVGRESDSIKTEGPHRYSEGPNIALCQGHSTSLDVGTAD